MTISLWGTLLLGLTVITKSTMALPTTKMSVGKSLMTSSVSQPLSLLITTKITKSNNKYKNKFKNNRINIKNYSKSNKNYSKIIK